MRGHDLRSSDPGTCCPPPRPGLLGSISSFWWFFSLLTQMHFSEPNQVTALHPWRLVLGGSLKQPDKEHERWAMGPTIKAETWKHRLRTTLETAMTHANFKQDKIMITSLSRSGGQGGKRVSWRALGVISHSINNMEAWKCSPFSTFQAHKRPNLFTDCNCNVSLDMACRAKACKWDLGKSTAVRIACALVP